MTDDQAWAPTMTQEEEIAWLRHEVSKRDLTIKALKLQVEEFLDLLQEALAGWQSMLTKHGRL